MMTMRVENGFTLSQRGSPACTKCETTSNKAGGEVGMRVDWWRIKFDFQTRSRRYCCAQEVPG